MPHVVVKLVKGALWGFMLLFVTSHEASYERDLELSAEAGRYELKSVDGKALQLQGNIKYERIREEWGTDQVPMLKLHLSNDGQAESHYLGFILGNAGATLQEAQGSYRINGDIDCFLTKFEGVFGFANINTLGEQPFFATRGNLVIEQVRDGILYGNMSIILENAGGKSLAMQGTFNATGRK